MTWFDWVLVSLFTFGALVQVSQVGKPRPATTPGLAVLTVVIDAALIVGVVTVR